ncbi:NACHT domain-containing protein [Sphingomonas sp. ASY06-1R]|uniref:NACHT domain-containing protein n=1 Tax=Sphingomonas sp. ASY06-1R TaxID=3445771 RepID=UPI003FA1FA6E
MYHYEVLGDERFQSFCQALIAASFPNAQCLPVGQPDGGRDAFILRKVREHRRRHAQDRELIVFQVKYVKKANDTRTEREMLEDVARNERNKVERLKDHGISKYILITNLRGTSHLEVGSIDRVNTILTDSLGVESYCWWRDDLDRRLDNSSSIKWSYPDILKATDLLEKLVAGQLGEGEERRRSAIRAYMTSQYDEDRELKFKQTDLRSTMADLFVDLPMRSIHLWSDRIDRATGSSMRPSNLNVERWYSRDAVFDSERRTLNAARHFLHHTGQAKLQNIVLEGAPGQGKSTVTQFICQVLRAHLLGKTVDLRAIQPTLRGSQIRIPFRVDLRDLAKWISGTDPFHSKQRPLDDTEPRSLEGFLAGQVRFLSGGHAFNVSDLAAIARASHVLLALDGFDEVAEINLRQQLVTEITKGVARLVNAGGFSIQTIVTSRPAAFAKSVRFPRENWSYFELLPLEQSQIDEYRGKWAKAKGLKEGESLTLKNILDAKLREPHTQYLAKNPMQLTILLSLLNSRGSSLPEKRTAMYDAYMDMFFSRESEKSAVVRDNRDLLIDIHRFLAWKLQTAAESGDNGSIEQSELRTTLFAYLDKEGEDTSIVDSLFNGIIERVGALVSRVQETYEFEVQPLREYFAAKHLYETAPYPSDEKPMGGDKFDRLRALVANPYWLNVARFYGGCFNKGEILTLVNELIELSQEDPFRLTSHPRSVALMLLGDWVFTQYQPAVRQIVAFIGEYPQLRQLLANAENGSSLWSGLPERSGRNDFVELLWQRLTTTRMIDEQRALSNAIQQNTSILERIDRWKSLAGSLDEADWARLGSFLQLYNEAPVSMLLAEDAPLGDQLLGQLLQNGRFDALDAPPYFDRAQALILGGKPNFNPWTDTFTGSRLQIMGKILWPFPYALASTEEAEIPLRVLVERRIGSDVVQRLNAEIDAGLDKLSLAEREAAYAYRAFLEIQSSFLVTNIEPWSELVAKLRAAWGDCPAIDRIASVAAGVRSRTASGTDVALSEAADLVAAARFVRLRSGSPIWWRNKLTADNGMIDRRRLLSLLLMWGTAKTFIKLRDVLDSVLSDLGPSDWADLIYDYKCLHYSEGRNEVVLSAGELSQLLSCRSRTKLYVGLRLGYPQRFQLAKTIVAGADGSAVEWQFAMQALVSECRKTSQWKAILPLIETAYARGAPAAPRTNREFTMPDPIALQVSSAPEKYPLALVALADAQLTTTAGSRAPRLLDVAQREGWFQ